jgi:hypothetical protein
LFSCRLSAPLRWTPDVAPVGVMFSARFGDEAMMFRMISDM